MSTIMALTMHSNMTFSVGIAVKILIYRIALAFTGSLTEIERSKVGAAITKQGVAKYKEIVYSLVATCHQRTTIGGFALIGGLDG